MLDDGVYTILAVSYTGSWAAPSIRTAEGRLRWTRGDYPTAEAGSLAALLHQTGFPYAFLDLRATREQLSHWLHQPMVIRQDLFNGNAIIPAHYCDGILFIDKMQPSEPYDTEDH